MSFMLTVYKKNPTMYAMCSGNWVIPENIHTLPWAASWNSGEGVGVEHFGFSGGGRVKMFMVPVGV